MFKEIIVVEGRDDTRRLKEIYPDVETLETNGSAVSFETLKRIKVLQEMRGVIVFTDPDFPGNKIRQKVNDFVPGCKQAYLRQKDAIGKNSCGVGVEHAKDDAIIEALSNLLTPNGTVVEQIEPEFLMHLNLVGHKNSSKLREQLSDALGIGYVNGKQLQKRLMMFGITKQQVVDALKE
ncbi:MAG TPA: ribonuclease M5 [Firmicutes bacterium]|nr:ribonuclease M5 [Bacillota bacterium]